LAGKEVHVVQANHNLELAEELVARNPLKFKDWAIIAAFYSAVHFIEAFRANLGSHSRNHEDRLKFVRDNAERKIEFKFKRLYQNSRSLRYLLNHGKNSPKGDWFKDNTVKERVKKDLFTIQIYVLNKLFI